MAKWIEYNINVENYSIVLDRLFEIIEKEQLPKKIIYYNIELSRTYIYMSEYEGKIFAFDGYCLVDCSKFYSTFNQIVDDSFHQQTSSITSTTSTDNDFIKQLKQLNDLYKSRVITKEEFEKAKKKILN